MRQNVRSKLQLGRLVALLGFAAVASMIALAGCSSAVDVEIERDERPEQAIGATLEPIIVEDPWLKGCCPQGQGWACPCLAIVVHPGTRMK